MPKTRHKKSHASVPLRRYVLYRFSRVNPDIKKNCGIQKIVGCVSSVPAALKPLPVEATEAAPPADEAAVLEVILSRADLQRFGVSLRRMDSRSEAVLIEPAVPFHQVRLFAVFA